MDKVQDILADLYAIDPAFRTHEPQLRRIVGDLLASKPEPTLDGAFVERLRAEILSTTQLTKPIKHYALMTPIKWIYAAAGTVAVIALAILATHLLEVRSPQSSTQGGTTTQNGILSSKQSIHKLADNAFGSLNNLNGSKQSQAAGGDAALNSPAMNSAGAGAAPQPAAPQSAAANASGAGSSAQMAPIGFGGGIRSTPPSMIMPPYFPYTFKYTGSVFTQPDAKLDVLERIGKQSGSGIISSLSAMNFGLVNLGSFGSGDLDSFVISQNQDFGYTISVNVTDGSISIYSNYSKWPNPFAVCNNGSDAACYERNQLHASDMISDSEAISVADKFIKDHGIPSANFGKPEVNNAWRIAYQSAPAKSRLYVPDSIQVLYPLRVNGKDTYEQGGSKAGMTVDVSVRYKKVSNIYSLNVQNFNASSYDAITDVQQIIQLAERGNRFNPVPMGPLKGLNSSVELQTSPSGTGSASGGTAAQGSASTVSPTKSDMMIAKPVPGGGGGGTIFRPTSQEIDLGTPTLAYVKMFNYTDNAPHELYVPAFVFPVTNPPSQYYGPQQIVVPIIKDLFNNGLIMY